MLASRANLSAMVVRALAVVVALLFVAACAQPEVPDGVEVVAGYEVEIAAEGFDGPTQLARTPEGDIVVAELAGGENDASGRVLLVDADLGNRTVLQTGLDKPTGVAVVGDALWIMERDRLSVTTLEPEAPRRVVLSDLPNNGRSEGTLTVSPSGSLLFDTSGRRRGADRVEGSGTIFEIERPSLADSSEPVPIAVGFKHAYAHAFTDDGRLFTVEMTDGTFDGAKARDELVAIEPGDDGGWPYCIDDNVPVADFGGTAERCASSPPSHALFGVSATPTSLLVAPWDDEVLLATLWLDGTVVRVPAGTAGAPHEPRQILAGLDQPQSLLADGDDVLVALHETGEILRLRRR